LSGRIEASTQANSKQGVPPVNSLPPTMAPPTISPFFQALKLVTQSPFVLVFLIDKITLTNFEVITSTNHDASRIQPVLERMLLSV